MIPNIVVPMPMPIHGGGSASDPKTFIAIFCAIFIVGLICYIIGWLKDGIGYGDWSLFDNHDSLWKIAGGDLMMVVLGFAALVFIGAFIYSLL